MPPLPPVDAVDARAAVATASTRVAALFRSARRTTAPALGAWDLTDSAVHLSHALDVILAMARGSGSMMPDLSGLGPLTRSLVRGESERRLAALAERVESTTAAFLETTRVCGDPTRGWLVEGTEAPMTMLVCHFLNELVVHGYDVATAEGVAWPIPRGEASLILRGFLFPAMNKIGRDLVNPETAAGVRAAFHIHLRGAGGAVMRFDDGELRVSAPPDGPVDCHLSVDPAAFLLVGWNRRSQWPAMARGQLLAWGRRPWLGVRLRSLLTNP